MTDRSFIYLGGLMSDDKKKKIVDAAIKVLADENYESMKTANIAKIAGVAQGTIYLYFKGKNEIFSEVIISIGDRISRLFFDNISSINSVIDNIQIIVKNFYQKRKETEGFYRIIYKAFSELDDSRVKIILDNIFEGIIDKIRMIITWARDKGEISIVNEDIDLAATLVFGYTETIWKKEILTDKRISEQELFMSLIKILKVVK